VIKFNIRTCDRDNLPAQLEAVRGSKAKLLAEEVETYDDYDYCRNAGFDFFEGYFFCKPKPAKDQPLPSNRLSTVHLLSRLQNPNVTLDELERAVGQDVALSHRLLRYLNSPMNPTRRKVDSLRHAISLVGTNLIRQWASVIWLESIEEKPRELMVMSMVRAHMCRQLGLALGWKDVDQFFTVGLLSFLDALLDRPMTTVLNELPLSEQINAALLRRSGVLGETLNCAEAYERCNWQRTRCSSLSEATIRDAYLGGVEWSRTLMNQLLN